MSEEAEWAPRTVVRAAVGPAVVLPAAGGLARPTAGGGRERS
ncbi:hypothetical protein [Streptomyces taklimakanensis]|nr:hypothetical protein [Streptomyces taklimakanensis]